MSPCICDKQAYQAWWYVVVGGINHVQLTAAWCAHCTCNLTVEEMRQRKKAQGVVHYKALVKKSYLLLNKKGR